MSSLHITHIVEGCPSLRKLSIETPDEEQRFTRGDFTCLLATLPNLELLTLNHSVPVFGDELGSFAHYCPRLMKLDLEQVVVYLSQEDLTGLRPLHRLELM